MYFAEIYFWQVSVPAALIICELLTRPHMILFSIKIELSVYAFTILLYFFINMSWKIFLSMDGCLWIFIS